MSHLIARTHGLFLMPPEILHLVGIVGAVTLVLAGFAALVQTDIKRVLASTKEPDWLHVPGAGRSGVGRGHFPPDDARVL